MALLESGPDDGPTLILAHGAGAPMDSAWMDSVATRLATRGVHVIRFEFAYMAARRSGVRKPPPRAERLLDEYRAVVVDACAASGPVTIGGKSMGGRVASMIADDLSTEGSVTGLACLGYPFHPPGKPEQTRTAHLENIRVPSLIVQGSRDPFGTRVEVERYVLSPSVAVHWLEDGEHDLKPRQKVSGFTHGQHLDTAAESVAAFIAGTRNE